LINDNNDNNNNIAVDKDCNSSHGTNSMKVSATSDTSTPTVRNNDNNSSDLLHPQVIYGEANTTKAAVEAFYNAKQKWDALVDNTAPSVILGVEPFKKAYMDFKKRGIKVRWITEITKDNLVYCKQMLELVDELRHMDNVKGNYGISESEYIAAPSLVHQKPISVLIRSTIKEMLEQQQYIFDSFWNIAIPAVQKIQELQDGMPAARTDVIRDPHKTVDLFINLVKSSVKEVLVVFPTINAFYREARAGIIDLLNEAADKRSVCVRILVQAGVGNDLKEIVKSLQLNGPNLVVRQTLQMPTEIRATCIVVDRKLSLVFEVRDDEKQDIVESIGIGTYSNSHATVSSYISFFESLWIQVELYDKAISTDIAKKEFISMVSHELRTPLTPIKAFAEMLLRPKYMDELNEKQKKAVEAIIRNAAILENLVKDVLDVYKLDMGKTRLSIANLDVRQMIDETISELRQLIGKTDDVKLASDIKVSPGTSVSCDPRRIRQVYGNLIQNSLDFIPKTGGLITLRVEQDDEVGGEGGVKQNYSNFIDTYTGSIDIINQHNINDNTIKSGYLLFTVQDNGVGIPADKADHLFKKFYQLDTRLTRKHGGTGLGLVICKGIVEAHGGKMWIDKTYTKGASIKFTLPAVRGNRMDNNSIQEAGKSL
jgi:two-component system, OmpR family, sensor histidine kinase VicK